MVQVQSSNLYPRHRRCRNHRLVHSLGMFAMHRKLLWVRKGQEQAEDKQLGSSYEGQQCGRVEFRRGVERRGCWVSLSFVLQWLNFY
jgi:hypothetical protein